MQRKNIKLNIKIASLVFALAVIILSAIVFALRNAPEELSRQELITQLVYTGSILCVFALLAASVLSKVLVRPLNSIHHTLEMVSKGELPEKSERLSVDEFGMLQDRLDELVDTLKSNAEFAQKIGEGKYDASFQLASEHDSLGVALINMRDNLLANDAREKERNWIVLGLAEASEILRTRDSLEALGDDIIRFTVSKVNAIQGAFYVVNEEEKTIELCNSFAYNRKKYLKKSFRFAEGLVGQAAIEQDMVLRTEIPDHYTTLTSGILGDRKPSCILIMPLIANEDVYGVIELAALTKFDQSQIKFIQELSTMLARTIFNIKVNERTRRLLAESQAMSNDLKEKQEVLRQNAEEMQATQEELTRSNRLLEEQMQEVSHTRNRMQLLLENASEVIAIYEETGVVRYISPSVETILGYAPQEIQGTLDAEHVHPEEKELYASFFNQMKQKPAESVTTQFRYKNKAGNYIWVEATGTNFMSNSSIQGYLLNSRDITERRRAELEQRMRSKMQALSENSTDLIARLEEGTISYINPVIHTYTGQETSAFINRKVEETSLDSSVLEKWLQIVEEVNNSGNKLSTEIDFPSELGKRVMQISAIPEYNEQEAIESVLVVSHDITDRKLIELDIQSKNKKINDSINYAKRIQNAILPDTHIIRQALPDSFILYKPRDVVSGDFPWFVQRGENIFIAAVDCTGHGVPGALLSLIGYFLLNDIIRSRQVTDPGTILDLLDEGVTETLRQDQDNSATKDGMDIALCKINTKTRTVEYAGAHRPLYVMKNGALEEIKGDRSPIGGGMSKNKTSFTTSKIKLNKGDSVYFSSDGYPDQFGGQEVRKFGSKRLRQLIEQTHHLSSHEAARVFDQQWEEWRGDQKQTDDVLMIGVKF
jgi:PAS domain S-box-containing protein